MDVQSSLRPLGADQFEQEPVRIEEGRIAKEDERARAVRSRTVDHPLHEPVPETAATR